jgi:hypothetical protein
MPHHPDDDRYIHLPLIQEEPNPDRRKRPGFAQTPPNRGGRGQFGAELRQRVELIEQEARARPQPPPGIQPHLVFRIPVAPTGSPGALAERLQELGITVVGIEREGAIIAFRDDANLNEFRQAVDTYTQGPRVNQQTGEPFASTAWDILELVEADQMRLWGRADRVGTRLAEAVGPEGRAINRSRLYVLDVELWHRGTRILAQQALNELRQLLADFPAADERLRDDFIGDTLCLARVSVRGAKLNGILDLDVVAEVDFPPTPVFDAHSAKQTTRTAFPTPPRPPAGGPSVCILDSGITSNHPLLANNIGHAEAVLTAATSPNDANGHGTMVGALAVFGDIRACYEAGQFQSDVTLYSARVLNDDNGFDDERLIIHQMRQAIELFRAEPYNCRVFNLSVGEPGPWLRDNRRQSIWAECLDLLARELKVLIVVSAGNHNLGLGQNARDSEQALTEYPRYLLEPDCGLCAPATAAIAVTVGGVAQQGTPTVRRGMAADNVFRVMANPSEPTPTSRIGPGLNDAVKPEFVAHAGNLCFDGFGSTCRTIRDDEGLAVMSFSNHPTETLFAFEVGTSFAAPVVSRVAARLWPRLREALGEEPDQNVVRAVLATAASVPQAALDRVLPLGDHQTVRRVCGYGIIDEELSTDSADRRVTLVTQGRIKIDSFRLYEVPVPPEFRQARGPKEVIVALAFDPPVRRRRAQYLGVEMNAFLVRGKTVEEIVEAYRAVTRQEREVARQEEREIPAAFQSPYRCPLEPGTSVLESSTLQRSEWTFQRESQDYGDSWYLLVRAERTWAPVEITEQDFGLAVTLHASEPELYNLLRQRVQVRVQQRARAQR